MDHHLTTRTSSTRPSKITLTASTSITLTILSTLVPHHWFLNPDPPREKLMRTGACFIYKKPGYITNKCPEKMKIIYKLNIKQGKDLSLLKTRPGTLY